MIGPALLALVLGGPDLERLPIPDAPFDAALACYSAVDVDGADAEIAAMFEYTKPVGPDARSALRLLAAAGGPHARASLAATLCGHRDPLSRALAADLLADEHEIENAFVLAIAADLEPDRDVRDVILENLDIVAGTAFAGYEERARTFLAARR